MKIIGFSLTKISIEKKENKKGNVSVKNSLDVENISEEEVPISNKPALKIDFFYIIDYEPNVAKVEIKGSVITIDEKEESKDILKEWKSKKTYTHESKLGLFNFILSKCNLKALLLEEELDLPLHIPFPKLVSEQKKEENKARYTG